MEGFIVSKKLLMCFTLRILYIMLIVHAKMHDAQNSYCRLNENKVNVDASTTYPFYKNGLNSRISYHKIPNTYNFDKFWQFDLKQDKE